MYRILWILSVLLVLVGCAAPEEQTPMLPTVSAPSKAVDVRPEGFGKECPVEDVLIVGDFRVCALQAFGCFPQADYACGADMTVYNVWNDTAMELLEGREYQWVIVCLGLNEAGYPLEGLERAYQKFVTALVHTQPQANVVLQGVIPVGKEQAKRVTYTCPERLHLINQMIYRVACRNRVAFVEFCDAFCDADGYLSREYSENGCHLNETAVHRWYGLLWDEIKKMR